ncbi:MAG: multidrug effflux MFS transporter [Thermoleophilia bacterium]
MDDTSPSIRQGDEARTRQKYLGNRGLIAFLALLSAFVPLSTDLYLPAMPVMTRHFAVPAYQTNLTLILFFVFYSLATLVWGPLSDKYGRRPILLVGLSVYTVAGALCAVAPNIYLLMLFRILQAVGAGSASAVATAIVKDVYEGKKRESILALVQSLVIISPAVAPIVGAFLLTLTSWRGTFAAQAVLGVIVVAGSVMFRETLAQKGSGSVTKTLGRLAVVIKNPVFAWLLVIFSTNSLSTMAFVASSSYIYQDGFGLSSQTYSYYFAVNAVGMMIGPWFYVRLSSWFERSSIITTCFILMVAGGLLVVLLGGLSPWMFALTLLPATVAASCSRPPVIYLLLEQQKADTGSASALMSSSMTVMGTLGMIIISFDWSDLVWAVGLLHMLVGAFVLTAWLVMKRKTPLDKVEASD